MVSLIVDVGPVSGKKPWELENYKRSNVRNKQMETPNWKWEFGNGRPEIWE